MILASSDIPIALTQDNHLLAFLPVVDRARFSAELEKVHLPLGKVLYESGAEIQHVYFPTTAIVSLSYVLESGATVGIAIAGNESVIGVPLFMGAITTTHYAVVQSEGYALRLNSECLKTEFERAESTQSLLLRYTQALFTQIAQTSVCSRYHLLDQQLCKWLLLNLDRLHSDEIVATQELIANMLGVRREGVTEAARRLQKAGLIRYRRGYITVINRLGLEQRTCECYAVIKKEYDRLLAEKICA